MKSGIVLCSTSASDTSGSSGIDGIFSNLDLKSEKQTNNWIRKGVKKGNNIFFLIGR